MWGWRAFKVIGQALQYLDVRKFPGLDILVFISCNMSSIRRGPPQAEKDDVKLLQWPGEHFG